MRIPNTHTGTRVVYSLISFLIIHATASNIHDENVNPFDDPPDIHTGESDRFSYYTGDDNAFETQWDRVAEPDPIEIMAEQYKTKLLFNIQIFPLDEYGANFKNDLHHFLNTSLQNAQAQIDEYRFEEDQENKPRALRTAADWNDFVDNAVLKIHLEIDPKLFETAENDYDALVRLLSDIDIRCISAEKKQIMAEKWQPKELARTIKNNELNAYIAELEAQIPLRSRKQLSDVNAKLAQAVKPVGRSLRTIIHKFMPSKVKATASDQPSDQKLLYEIYELLLNYRDRPDSFGPTLAICELLNRAEFKEQSWHTVWNEADYHRVMDTLIGYGESPGHFLPEILRNNGELPPEVMLTRPRESSIELPNCPADVSEEMKNAYEVQDMLITKLDHVLSQFVLRIIERLPEWTEEYIQERPPSLTFPEDSSQQILPWLISSISAQLFPPSKFATQTCRGNVYKFFARANEYLQQNIGNTKRYVEITGSQISTLIFPIQRSDVRPPWAFPYQTPTFMPDPGWLEKRRQNSTFEWFWKKLTDWRRYRPNTVRKVVVYLFEAIMITALVFAFIKWHLATPIQSVLHANMLPIMIIAFALEPLKCLMDLVICGMFPEVAQKHPSRAALENAFQDKVVAVNANTQETSAGIIPSVVVHEVDRDHSTKLARLTGTVHRGWNAMRGQQSNPDLEQGHSIDRLGSIPLAMDSRIALSISDHHKDLESIEAKLSQTIQDYSKHVVKLRMDGKDQSQAVETASRLARKLQELFSEHGDLMMKIQSTKHVMYPSREEQERQTTEWLRAALQNADIDDAPPGTHSHAVVIPCHESVWEDATRTLKSALKHFTADMIYVIENSRDLLPQTRFYHQIKQDFPGIHYIYVPIGCKNTAQYAGAIAIKNRNIERILTIDDDVVLPANFWIPTAQSNTVVAFGIRAITRTGEPNIIVEGQDIEYLLAAAGKSAEWRRSRDVTHVHGAISSWPTDVFLRTFRQIPCQHLADDLWMSFIAMRDGVKKIIQLKCDLIMTFAPESWHGLLEQRGGTNSWGLAGQVKVWYFGIKQLLSRHSHLDLRTAQGIWSLITDQLFHIYLLFQLLAVPLRPVVLGFLCTYTVFWLHMLWALPIPLLPVLGLMLITWRRDDIKLSWRHLIAYPLHKWNNWLFEVIALITAIFAYWPNYVAPPDINGWERQYQRGKNKRAIWMNPLFALNPGYAGESTSSFFDYYDPKASRQAIPGNARRPRFYRSMYEQDSTLSILNLHGQTSYMSVPSSPLPSPGLLSPSSRPVTPRWAQ